MEPITTQDGFIPNLSRMLVSGVKPFISSSILCDTEENTSLILLPDMREVNYGNGKCYIVYYF